MTEFTKLNYINIGPGGTFRPSGNLQTSAADIDAIFKYLEQSNTKKLAVHFHGGLVKEESGEGIARNMKPVYEAGGAHSLTFIWETGLVETITRNLTDIHNTKLFQKLIRYVFKQLTKRLGADISGRGPSESMTMAEIETELSKIDKFEVFESRARSGAQSLDEASLEQAKDEMTLEYQMELQADQDFLDSEEKLLFQETYLKSQIEADLREDGRGFEIIKVARTLARVTYRVLKRYWKGRDHGLYPTTVEELLREFYLDDFGAWVWDGMKTIAKKMWYPNSENIDQYSHPGTYFLEKLGSFQSENPGFIVDFVGHSAGAIAICQMLKSANLAGTIPEIRNIVFLAPACTSQLMHNEIVSKEERYESFRMFTMQDKYEKEDRLVPFIYTRSLLYFISGVLEPNEVDTPIAGMERFWTGEKPFEDDYLVSSAAWLKSSGKNRNVLSVTESTISGMKSESVTHGGFDNDEKTLSSLTYIISQ